MVSRLGRLSDSQALIRSGVGKALVVRDENAQVLSNAESSGEMQGVEAAQAGRPKSGRVIQKGVVEWQ